MGGAEKHKETLNREKEWQYKWLQEVADIGQDEATDTKRNTDR